MAADSIRAFIAADPAPGQAREIQVLMHSLARADADVKWVEPQNLHLTLRFLGDIPVSCLAPLDAALRDAAAGAASFDLNFSGTGAFPDIVRPRVVWAGVAEGRGALCSLAAALGGALSALGFAPEDRPFAPHLTLGRVRGPKNLARLSALLGSSAGFSCTRAEKLAHFTLLKSTLLPSGPVYEALGRYPLSGS